jgi:hypothetical protein
MVEPSADKAASYRALITVVSVQLAPAPVETYKPGQSSEVATKLLPSAEADKDPKRFSKSPVLVHVVPASRETQIGCLYPTSPGCQLNHIDRSAMDVQLSPRFVELRITPGKAGPLELGFQDAAASREPSAETVTPFQ